MSIILFKRIVPIYTVVNCSSILQRLAQRSYLLAIKVCFVVFLGFVNRIVLVKCLFPEVFQHLLNCFAHLFIGLRNELSTIQIVLLVLHYYF